MSRFLPFPRPYAPCWLAAIGCAFGFYPFASAAGSGGSSSRAAAALLALGLGSLASALAAAGRAGAAPLQAAAEPRAASPRASSLPPGRPRLAPEGRLAAELGSLAFGLVLGLGLALDLAGAPAPGRFEAMRLRPVAVRGRLAADPGPPSARGTRRYILSLESLSLAGSGLSGELSAAGGLEVLARESAFAAAGSLLLAEGAFLEASPTRSGPVEAPPFMARSGGVRLSGQPSALARLRARLLEGFVAALERAAGGDRKSAGLLVALLSGSREGLSTDDAGAFKAAGCSHVLALSGQHLGILSAALGTLLGPLVGRRRALLLALACGCLFVFVAGPGPSLLRSLLFAACSTGAFLADRPQTGRQLAGLAFLLGIVLDPGSATSLSFILSQLAIAGLVLLAPRFEFLLLPFVPPFLATVLAASLGAQASTGPFLLLAMGQFQPVGILASALSAPLVLVFMYWGMAAAPLSALLPPLGPALAAFGSLAYRALSGLMGLAASLSLPVLPEGPPRLLLALGIGALGAFVYAWPHVEHRRSALRSPDQPHPRLRLALRPPRPPRGGGPRDEQEVRAELPREPPFARADP